MAHDGACPDNEEASHRSSAHLRDGAEPLLPPVDFCKGVRPSQAAKSRPDLNVSAGGASAAIAVAVMGPTPGIVIKRRATGSSLERRPISSSGRPMFSSSAFRDVTRTLRTARALSGRWQL